MGCVSCVELGSLTIYTFRVTDKNTGLPVQGAQCAITDQPMMVMPFDGEGCITGADGVCSVDVVWFVPRYYSVYKAGYKTARGSVPGTTITVALESTEVLYWVLISAGAGGRVDPSGTLQVKANTKLTVTAYPDSGYILKEWLLNGAPSGNTNPIGVIIDRDSYSIAAVFKVADTPPPPPTPPEWPVEREVHVFDSVILDGGWGLGVSKSTTVKNVDTAKLLGGKIEYTITYVSARLAGITAYIEWNGEVVAKHPFSAFDVGKSVSGTVDLTGKITHTNSAAVRFSQGPLGFNRVLFDVWAVLGFSEAPVIDPVVPPDLDWWWPWAIAGGAVAVVTVTGAVLYSEAKRREEMMLLIMARK